MASLHVLNDELYGESTNDAAIQAATTIAMKVVLRGDRLRVMSSQTIRFQVGAAAGSWKARLEIADQDASTLIFRANFDTSALLFNTQILKSAFSDGVYYTIYLACGPSDGGRIAVRQASDGALVGGTTNGTTRTLGTGTDMGKLWVIRSGPFTTNPGPNHLAGFAVQSAVPADEWSEPDAGACLSLCYFDDTSGTTVSVEAGNPFDLKHNSGAAVEGTNFEWLPAEGPWNGGGGSPAPDAFVKIVFRGIAS